MKTETMAEIYALRELIDPSNPLARQLIDEQIDSGEEPGPLFFGKLQVAWRDGRLSAEEIAFCREMKVEPLVYVRIRGRRTFEQVLSDVFELDVKRLHTGDRKPRGGRR